MNIISKVPPPPPPNILNFLPADHIVLCLMGTMSPRNDYYFSTKVSCDLIEVYLCMVSAASVRGCLFLLRCVY